MIKILNEYYLDDDYDDSLDLSDAMINRILKSARTYYAKHKDRGITKEDALVHALEGLESYIDDISEGDYCDLLYLLGDN